MAKKNTQTKTPQKKREKVNSEMYKLEVLTFEEAIDTLKEIPGMIGNRFLEANPECIADAIKVMTGLFMDHVPDIDNRENQFWSINASMDRCFVKTSKFFGFGWIIDKTYNKGKFEINKVTLSFVSYNPMKTVDEINYLNKAGWVKEEK